MCADGLPDWREVTPLLQTVDTIFHPSVTANMYQVREMNLKVLQCVGMPIRTRVRVYGSVSRVL